MSRTGTSGPSPYRAPVVDVAADVRAVDALFAAQRAGDAERTEARGDPAVPPDALPDARTPRVVAQSERRR